MQPNHEPVNQPNNHNHGDLPPVSISHNQNATANNGGGLLFSKKPFYLRPWFISIVVVMVAALVGAGVFAGWYSNALEPVSNSDADAVQVTIEPGTTPDQIASQLQSAGVVKSSTAFSIYTRIHDVRGRLQAGSYRLLPTESTPEIVAHLLKGQSDEFTVTFYPGSALSINAYDSDQTPSHREVLESLGYSRSEIEAAFEAEYDHPLLADKPAGATIEGYIYGETYQMPSGASLKEVLVRTFDEMYTRIQQKDLLEAFERRDMDLHEAVTLASVIEREVHDPADQKQVAQIFLKRLDEGMPLGADATFVYAARMDGQTPTVNYDSPYNTRVNRGLPPGPIASPGITALEAVANPASGDYLYFVSGDDGTNYFSKTLEEHESNTRRYCQANCSLF